MSMGTCAVVLNTCGMCRHHNSKQRQDRESVLEECNLKQICSLERRNSSVLSWVEAAEHALPTVHDEVAHTRLL